jgi:hypothetical protein
MAQCRRESRCPICGYKLTRVLWFAGGPLSAFDPNGRYFDPAVHGECARYAIQVCPYLAAAPNYSGRVDAATLDPKKLPKGCPALFMDLTQIPERPEVFVVIATRSQSIEPEYPHYITPGHPYVAVEYCRHGQQLTAEQAAQYIPRETA